MLIKVLLLSLTKRTIADSRVPFPPFISTLLKASISTIQSEASPAFYGLLTGFKRQPNITAFPEMHYTDELNFSACKDKFYKEDDILWRSFTKDVRPDESPGELIESIAKAAEDFVNSNDICGQSEVIENLKLIKKGDIVILTGPASTGKSLVLKHLFGNKTNYLYLDSSLTGPDIIKAIVNNLIKRDKLRSLTVGLLPQSSISSLKQMIGNEYSHFLTVSAILIKILDVLYYQPRKILDSLELILELMSNLDQPIEGIIFFEANKYFNGRLDQSLPILQFLTALSKQDRRLSVIMATTDFGFSFSLDKIGYNRNHISKSLVLSDVSPRHTLNLLSSWGVRPCLAYLLVEIYGGHILQIYRALSDLHHKKEKAMIDRNFIYGLEEQINACKSDINKLRLMDMSEAYSNLETLMRTGFLACSFDDPLVAILTKHAIAGFVGKRVIVSGLSDKVRENQSGLVVSTQMIRVVFSLDQE